ncbi:nucleoid-structuring protein H-NS [Chryseolinea lacunae]|uniref:Nucleoid-structuring protein H-NS n=1 Tax=Chryseolinea lacunae TaxID=2801331 RepID=A0ABS1KMX0_9BACT|nr:nucleoid-structuring protein H-NS [Chryseolinea lacunae]MBL0740805.1 nucleoid-structuring protein H-NS [Chryseolinea lacunae]
MNAIRKSSKFFVIALVVVSCALGCKSKKKAMEAAAAAEKAKTEQEAALRKKQEQEAEAKLKAEAEAKAKREAEERERQAASAASTPAVRLGKYFDTIAGSGNTSAANTNISEALGLFASPDTPVLIVISEENGMKDYDKPTNIKNYLNYLKDQKKNINRIQNLVFDSAGKITELELRKD